MKERILFIGAGKMAGAIAGGLVRRDAAMARVITAFDPNPAAVETFKENTQANAVSSDVVGLADKAQVILIAVKPQMINEALAPLTGKLKDKLIISIAAGITLERLYELTQSERIVRVMPNTPALVGAGISVFTDSGKLSENDAKITLEILSSIGKALPVAERMLDAVTGLSGCGPAYVFDFLIALAAGGVQQGLPYATAMELAVQTVIGSARLVAETGEHPAVLRDQVISPGGAPAVGCAVVEKNAFRGIVAQAVVEAAKRSEELGKK